MYYFFFDESAGPGAVTETHATNPFQSIKHVRDDGSEYWLARESYKQYLLMENGKTSTK